MSERPSDLRCVRCGHGDLLADASADAAALAFRCPACDTVYPSVLGVPYFGGFECEDIPGLIEIAANVVNRGKFGVTPAVVEQWERVVAEYDKAEDREAFVAGCVDAQSPYFLNRYGEWLEISRLTADLDLDGKAVLDMGAGLGFDSHRLVLRGARVTALEFSPVLAEAGRINFPNIRWIGGFSHCLPFRSGSFDAVFCNAALHHMRDIPAAISEALRVLRPGGVLITTCDSFRPSAAGDDAELEIFDREPAVLMGVNEGIPKFSDFISVLQRHADCVDTEVFTHALYGGPLATVSHEFRRWGTGDWPMLSARSGSLALRATVRRSPDLKAPLQTSVAIAPETYADWLSSASNAIANLSPLMPEKYVDLAFPGTAGSKFELLNGWRLPRPFQKARTAYQRGRWFLRRPLTADALSIEFTLPDSQTRADGTMDVLLDGVIVSSVQVAKGVVGAVVVGLEHLPAERVFALEMRLHDAGDTIESGSFEVLSRRFIIRSAAGQAASSEAQAACPTVFAVIPVFNRLHFTRECVARLKAQQYRSIRIIVSDGGSTDGTVDAIRSEHPDVRVLESPTELWWTGAMAQGIDAALEESAGNDDFVLMMNNDTVVPDDYVGTLVQASRRYDAAVGALVVDSAHPEQALDAGEYIDWTNYSFPVRSSVAEGERFCDDVDVLPGRGSLVPLRMIRAAGNVDAVGWPHYLADYEFFCRLKASGFRLGVSYETTVLAHIDETGIVPQQGVPGLKAIYRQTFSRRSMSNVVDHWRFVSRHAPAAQRTGIRMRLVKRVLVDFSLRTELRPVFLPLYWLLMLPYRLAAAIPGQRREFGRFVRDVRVRGRDVLCKPDEFPKLIRGPLYLLASPAPLSAEDCRRAGVRLDELLAAGTLRQMRNEGWYSLTTLKAVGQPHDGDLRALRRRAWNPVRKAINTMAYRRTLRQQAGR